jgi:NAD(P)-dependent dehydrogenase (short-subunit alcohol dehydrogenase family)
MDMSDKVAVVTGAASGIGRATARAVAAAGARGLALVDLHDGVRETAEAVQRDGLAVEVFICDLGSVAQIRDTFAGIRRAFDRVDAGAFVGGYSYRSRTLDTTEEEWDRVIDANLRGAFFCNQEALRLMYEQRAGSIVNMSADAAFYPVEGFAIQAAGKGGIWHMTQVLALEAAPKGVRVNAISPGNTSGGGKGVRVPRVSWPTEQHATPREAITSAMVGGRMFEPEEIANAIVFLCSDASSAISGTLLHANAGGYYTMRF